MAFAKDVPNPQRYWSVEPLNGRPHDAYGRDEANCPDFPRSRGRTRGSRIG